MPPVLSLARGVPLALALVTPSQARSRPEELPNESAVLAALAERIAEDLAVELKETLEAARLIRRTTRPMLSAMLGRPCDDKLFSELAELSFVEYGERYYVAHPSQWALYAATRELEGMMALGKKLGFAYTELRHGEEETVRLEFGAAGVWSWLRRLVNATELGQRSGSHPVPSERAGFRLDESARGLEVDGAAVALSALEYHALAYLLENAGRVVTRDALLDEVWQQRHTGSNVVDAVVRLIRKKLGRYANELETIRGHGYRITRAASPK